MQSYVCLPESKPNRILWELLQENIHRIVLEEDS